LVRRNKKQGEAMTRDELLESLKWRYAVKQFDPSKKISSKDLGALLESLRFSPSSFGLQAWKFLVVESDDLKQRLKTQSWNQNQVDTCSHYVVFTTLKEVSPDYVDECVKQMSELRGTEVDALKGYRDVIVNYVSKAMKPAEVQAWTQRQSYIAMGFLMLAAAALKVDTCPMEGINPTEYDKILGLENSDYKTVAAVALGYRHTEDKYQKHPKFRFSQEQIIEFR